MIRSTESELLDIWDYRGRFRGTQQRNLCHWIPGNIHRAVHIYVFDSAQNIYLQKRSLTKSIQPGKWDTSVGGHVDAGETFEQAAYREMKEELGLQADHPLLRLFTWVWRSDRETEVITTFLYQTDQRPVFDPVEITELRKWPEEELSSITANPEFTPCLSYEWKMLLDYFETILPQLQNFQMKLSQLGGC